VVNIGLIKCGFICEIKLRGKRQIRKPRSRWEKKQGISLAKDLLISLSRRALLHDAINSQEYEPYTTSESFTVTQSKNTPIAATSKLNLFSFT
jgi:hypothetical protein